MMFMNTMIVQKQQKRPLIKSSCFWEELASPPPSAGRRGRAERARDEALALVVDIIVNALKFTEKEVRK